MLTMKAVLLLLTAAACIADDTKVVLVTGASSGIGLAASKHLASKGYAVVLTARRVEKLQSTVEEITAAGGRAMHAKVDVTVEAEIQAAFELAEQTYGGVDYVFINAGYEGPTHLPFEEQQVSDHKKVFDINILGMLTTMQCALKALKNRGGGAMVLTSSVAGTFPADMFGVADVDFAAAYTMSKAATDMQVRVGKSYLRHDIRVYGIKPAVYMSEMPMRHPGGAETLTGLNPFFKGRVGDPSFLAEVVEAMFDGSTQWQPGQNIICDGDATFDSKIEYEKLETVGVLGPTREEYREALRDAKGGPYHCTTESSCKIYEGKKEEL